MKINNLSVKLLQRFVKTSLFSVLAVSTLGLGGLAIPTEAQMQTAAATFDLPEISNVSRIKHSKEVLGKLYRGRSAKPLRELETVSSLHRYVFRRVFSSLPSKNRSDAFSLTKSIIESSVKHSMDPLFVLAVIETESSFRPGIRGAAGEIGLMQIKPDTAAWITGSSIEEMKNALCLTHRNVEIGVEYISKLRQKFPGKANLYVAAYNMGAAKVREKVSIGTNPKVYYSRVISKYISLSTQMMKEIADKEAKDALKTAFYTLNTTSPAIR